MFAAQLWGPKLGPDTKTSMYEYDHIYSASVNTQVQILEPK